MRPCLCLDYRICPRHSVLHIQKTFGQMVLFGNISAIVVFKKAF